MKDTVGNRLEVKASEEEKSRRLRKMIEAGATRIASAGVQIIEGLDSNSDY